MRLFATLAMLFIGMVVFSAGTSKVYAQSENNKNNQISKKGHSENVLVKEGDTLTKIANGHKTTYIRIFYANKDIKNPNLIYAGEKIRIPSKDEKLKARPLEAYAPKTNFAAGSQVSPIRSNSARTSVAYSSVNGGVWDKIAQCESGGNWSTSTGNGYYGGLQFTASSWHAAGGSGLPSQASKSEQIARAKVLQSRQGWGAWPACTAKLGIR